MTFIKITDKHRELKLRFDQPYKLDNNYNYKLGIKKIFFEVEKFKLENFSFKLKIHFEGIIYTTEKIYQFNNFYNIASLKLEFQEAIHNSLIESHNYFINKEMKEINEILKQIERNKYISVNFKLEILSTKEDKYVLMTLPNNVEILLLSLGNFNELFAFTTEDTLKNGATYKSLKNSKLLYPFPYSVIEWECMLTEDSYSNMSDNPHVHMEHNLLHVSSIENKLFIEDKYFETIENGIKATLNPNIREIIEIQLIPLDQFGNQIPLDLLKNVVLYLELFKYNK